MMAKALVVGVGGFAGAASRFLVGTWVQERLRSTDFPYGTLAVNLIGCFLIGVVAGIADRGDLVPAHLQLLLVAGFLGGFTTFSAFGYETAQLAGNASFDKALLNVFVQLAGGLLAVSAGLSLSRVLT